MKKPHLNYITVSLVQWLIIGVILLLAVSFCVPAAQADTEAEGTVTTQVVGPVLPFPFVTPAPAPEVCPLNQGWNLVTLRGNDTLLACDTVWIYLP